jgi:transposase
MVKRQERHHAPAFKAKVALDAIRDGTNLEDLARIHNLQVDQIADWRAQLLKRADEIFRSKTTPCNVPTVHDGCDPHEFDHEYFGLC